jgi:hypothetical protein
LAFFQKELETLVALRGSAEAGVLADGPELAPVHRRLDAAGERIFARVADVAIVVDADSVSRGVEGLDG